MEFVISSSTDVGTVKNVNQDSLFVRNIKTEQGNMAIAVICDGMGGYSDGEIASRTLLNAFLLWEANTLPALLCGSLDDYIVREQWSNIIFEQNRVIRSYGLERGIQLGTTITALFVTQTRWYCINVGDTRAYELAEDAKRLTRDQTYVENEISMGRMTVEQAEQSNLRNALLQCVGIDEIVKPEVYFGDVKKNSLFLLCSDGFRHLVSENEMLLTFRSIQSKTSDELMRCEKSLIELNKYRGEKDNISVATILVS